MGPGRRCTTAPGSPLRSLSSSKTVLIGAAELAFERLLEDPLY
jgi:hypothetical protein